MHWAFIVVSLTAVLTIGCGSSDNAVDPGPGPDPSTLVEQGWSAFEIGDYVTAASKFDEALVKNAFDVVARNGLGFANMKLGNLREALENFKEAIEDDDDGFLGADPHAGRAVILRDINPVNDIDPVDYVAAIDAANEALRIDASFIFTHDTSFDHKDLRLILAQAYFALRQYTNAKAEVEDEALGGRDLDETSPTFVDDLLAEIERLGNLYGG